MLAIGVLRKLLKSKLFIRRQAMLGWAVTFLVIALIAAVLGFGGVAGTATGIAKILFFVFLIVFIVSLITGLARPRRGL
jgi:uncharacterized membrane protein YtjA (UPF0391 family)